VNTISFLYGHPCTPPNDCDSHLMWLEVPSASLVVVPSVVPVCVSTVLMEVLHLFFCSLSTCVLLEETTDQVARDYWSDGGVCAL